MEQVASKPVVSNQFFKVLVGRCDDAHINRDLGNATHTIELAFRHDPEQPALQIVRHVSDLVQKQRSLFRLLKSADAALIGTGESPFFVTEQFGFKQISGDGRCIDRDKYLVASNTVIVQGSRDQLFSGP